MSVQGEGGTTGKKLDGFCSLFDFSLGVSMNPLVRDRVYWHIDLNCGSGFNEKTGYEGSPVLFLRRAMKRQRKVRAFFCDKDADRIGQLKFRLSMLDLPPAITYSCHCSDNALFLPDVTRFIGGGEDRPALAIGTVLCDPNGIKDIPHQALAQFAHDRPRMDVILHINCNAFKAVKWCQDQQMPGFGDLPKLRDLIPSIPKRYSFIRNPQHGGKHRFSTYYGTNAEVNEKAFRGFYPLTSSCGRKILETLNRQVDGQQDFTDDLPDPPKE